MRGRYWAFVALFVVAIHLQLSLILPNEIWTTPIGIGSACVLALVFCVDRGLRARSTMRWRWLLLAITFLFWTAASAAIVHVLAAGMDLSMAQLDTPLYMLRGVPLLILLSQSGLDDDDRSIQIADGIQAALFALLVLVLFYPALSQGQDPELPFTENSALAYHDVQNFGLALLSLVSLIRPRPHELRRFDLALATLLTVYAIVAWLVNHLSINAVPAPPPGSVKNVAGDLPMLAFILVAAGAVPLLKPFPDSRFRLVVSLILPVAFCVASTLAAVAIGSRYPILGALGAVAAIALFAFRSAIVQARLVEARRNLSSARDELRALANIDALTDLPNRRFFDDRLAAEWRRLGRFEGMLAITLIDIDHFKLYNDTQGHLAGDACLRRVADLMRSCVRREGDFLARIGGEEFALISPVEKEEEASNLAETIRTAVEVARLPHSVTETGVVTLSLGVAVLRVSKEAASQTLIERADRALYRAKTAGRNRVEVEPLKD